jgi:hypothetical protein
MQCEMQALYPCDIQLENDVCSLQNLCAKLLHHCEIAAQLLLDVTGPKEDSNRSPPFPGVDIYF